MPYKQENKSLIISKLMIISTSTIGKRRNVEKCIGGNLKLKSI